MRLGQYRNLVLASSAFLISLLFISLHRSTDGDVMLQIPIVLGSQMLAPYQYNYNRPETIPTMPASSDISYTVSREVAAYKFFFDFHPLDRRAAIHADTFVLQEDDFSDYIEIFPTRSYDAGTVDAMRFLGKTGEEGIPLGYEGPLKFSTP